jgi:Na+-driven multidrug efflux pump
MTPCALFSAVEGPIRSAMRGAGNTFAPMVVSMITAVGLRQVLLFLTKHFISNDLVILSLSHPATWCITMLVLYPLYLATFRRLRERAESEPTKTDLA